MTITGDEIEKFRLQLIGTKSELEALAGVYKDTSETVELDQCTVGRLSRMDAMQAQQMSLETDQRRQNQIIKIESALRRIESGDFGYCYICEEEIDARRLAADPAITRCMNCADN